MIIEHLPSSIRAEANEQRTQAGNRQVAIFRLRLLMALQIRCQSCLDGGSRLWQSRRQGQRLSISVEHHDYPALLAEALDWLDRCNLDHSDAAQHLGITPSQWLKLVRAHPAALIYVNRLRQQAMLTSLK